ncbi:MAG: Dabb family protein [Phycisphaerales bacterium]|nr:Dabb family protein [Phycisphaerales bacterium]
MFTKICMIVVISIAFLTTSLVSGCADHRSKAPRTALIGHVVFIELNDSSDYDELLADSDSMLATIESVRTYSAGKHIDTGRASVINDYDFAIYLGFESVDDLAAYVADEQHVAFVNLWKPKLKALRVYDIHDPSK